MDQPLDAVLYSRTSFPSLVVLNPEMGIGHLQLALITRQALL
ncbi:MAG: hypothetical protein ABF868_09315 [Sporolactobacillus sp.]